MEENAIQINDEITVNVDVSVKNAMYVKQIIFGILLHVVVKMENISQVLWIIQQLCAMNSSNKEKNKLFQQILRKRTQSVKRKISIFYLHFC